TWASPRSRRPATTRKDIVESPSRRSAASTTSSGSGSNAKEPGGPRRNSGGCPERKPDSADMKTTASARRSSRPPNAPDGASPSRISGGYAAGSGLVVETLEIGRQVGRSTSSTASSRTRRRTRESPSCRWTLATRLAHALSAAIARSPTARPRLSSSACIVDSPLTPIGTPLGTSELWPNVTRPQDWRSLKPKPETGLRPRSAGKLPGFSPRRSLRDRVREAEETGTEYKDPLWDRPRHRLFP